ncbi:hypothetical protein M885DRAFT_558401 [Pelagophyceae sp. CCMP2097]|nr:hypothetical protein M885DRAFT_558401 [Pelagophyceae sp. CCMP2097]
MRRVVLALLPAACAARKVYSPELFRGIMLGLTAVRYRRQSRRKRRLLGPLMLEIPPKYNVASPRRDRRPAAPEAETATETATTRVSFEPDLRPADDEEKLPDGADGVQGEDTPPKRVNVELL